MPRVWKHMLVTCTTIGVIVSALLVTIGRSNTQEMAQAVDLPDVEVVQVAQQDVPISSEWIGTLDGMVNATIKAQVTGYQTYDEIFNLLKSGEIDAFALSRDQLNALAKKIPGTRVLDETFKKTVTAVAVPLNRPLSLAFVSKFMTDATSNGTLRKAYDSNGLKEAPIRTQ